MKHNIFIDDLSMKEKVFNFKRDYYLQLLHCNDFNVFKVARLAKTSRGDILNHVGTSKKEIHKLYEKIFGITRGENHESY